MCKRLRGLAADERKRRVKTHGGAAIEAELEQRIEELEGRKKLLEAQRLGQRTRHDLEMLRATGMCQGIENYSRHFDGRTVGQPAATLLHYLHDAVLLVVGPSIGPCPASAIGPNTGP